MNKRAAILCLIPLIFLGCKGSYRNGNGYPDKLIIGIYAGDNPSQVKADNVLFQHYLEKELNMQVEFLFTTDYTTLIEGMQRKKLDVAQLPPFAYVLATEKPCLVPIAAFAINHVPATYHSAIITSATSGIKTMDDVKRRSKQLTLCFADPASTSGHLVPRAYLKSIGLDPDSAFKQTVFAGSHVASIMSVQAGKIDIGCTSNDLALDKLIREGTVKREDFVILWISGPLINDAITASTDLDKGLIKKIQDAYLNVSTKDYKAFSGAIHKYYANPENMQFIPIDDSVYNPIRKIAKSIKELNLIK